MSASEPSSPSPSEVLLAPVALEAGAARAVDALRILNEVVLRRALDQTGDLTRVAVELEHLGDLLAEGAVAPVEVVESLPARELYSRHDPVSGSANPVAPPIEVSGLPDGSVVGHTRLGLLQQGPPGLVHGGVLALVMDHVLAMANSWAGTIGMTARLELRYLRPTPLFADLLLTARQERVEGSRIVTTGQITHGGEVCVEASGDFVAFRPAPAPRPGVRAAEETP